MQMICWVIMVFAWFLGGCATSNKGSGNATHDDKNNSNSEKDDESKNSKKNGNQASDELYVSSNYVTLTYSLSNNSLTSKTINISKAKDFASDLEGRLSSPSTKDRKDIIALMAAKRLAGEGVGPVFQTAKKLMILEMREDIRRDMPEVAQLELALAAIHSRQFPMAEHWLDKLMSSKNDKTRAAAYTSRGMIAMIDGRLPEAAALWNEALAQMKDYEPARLNIGFTALRYGDFKTAKAMLSGIADDWFTLTAHIQIERLADNPKEAAKLCAALMEKRKNYKPALFSCALNEYQGIGNLAKARQGLEELAKTDGGPSIIDERAYLTIGKIEKDQREQALKEKAAAAARIPAATGVQPGSPAGTGGGTKHGTTPAAAPAAAPSGPTPK